MSWCFSLNRPMSVLTRLEHLPYPRPDALPFQPLPACPSCQAVPSLSSQRSDKVLADCNFSSVHQSYLDSYLTAFTLYGLVRLLHPYHPLHLIQPLNPFALLMFSTPLCLYFTCLNSSQHSPSSLAL